MILRFPALGCRVLRIRLPIQMSVNVFFLSLVILLANCSSKGGKQPAGAGGGSGDGGDGVDQNTNSGETQGGGNSSQQNDASNGSDNTTQKQPPPPDGGAGYGRPNFGNGYPGGSPYQTRPQVESINNPHPNVSSAQGCTMQRQSSFSGGSGLRLDESAVATVPAPPSISLWVERTDKAGVKTTSHCSGVLSMREYPNIALDDPNAPKDKPKNKSSAIFFPRISLATHCIGTTNDSTINTITLISTTDPDKKTVVSANQFFSNIAISRNKLFNFNEFKQSSTKDDPCTIKVKAAGDNKSPCFTLGADQVDLITKREEAFIQDYFFKSILTPFGFGEFAETAGNWLRKVKRPRPEDNEVDWLKEYYEGNNKNVTTLAIDDNQQVARGLKSPQEVMEYFNRSLLAITTTRPTRKPNQELLPFTIQRPRNGWGDILEVFGSPSTEKNPDGSNKNAFIISSVRLKDGDHGFKQGDSGIWLIGEFLEANAPLLTVRSFREVMGVLSTVGGVDVCAGDDLLCCDRS